MSEDDAAYLLIPEPCTSMMYVERALTVGVRIVVFHISLVGSPLCIATEPSGELSISRWVEGKRNVHAGTSFMLRPGLLGDASVADPYSIIVNAFAIAGLCAKHCEGHEESSSMPGLKSNAMIPQALILLWEYELKTPFGRELCCIVKELFGKGLRMGFLCWVRKWKSENDIPCGKYPTIAYMRMGAWTESIADRPLPEKLANFRLKTPTELAKELVRINDALPEGAKKRKHINQDHVGGCGIGESQAESQSIAQILQPLKDVISKIPTIRLSSEQQALLTSSLAVVSDMSSLQNDDFDSVPEDKSPDDMDEAELRALVHCLFDQARRQQGSSSTVPQKVE